MRRAALALAAIAVLAFTSAQLSAEPRPGFGQLYYNDTVVRTVVPPAATPKRGRDDFFAFATSADGQLAVIAVAPGDRGYHGGQWAFHLVTWNVDPYLITSAAGVHAAAGSGDVSIQRNPDNDFKCPVQP